MKCNCGTNLERANGIIFCPKCGWSMLEELIIKMYEWMKKKPDITFSKNAMFVDGVKVKDYKKQENWLKI